MSDLLPNGGGPARTFMLTLVTENMRTAPRTIEAESLHWAMAEFTKNWGADERNDGPIPWAFTILVERPGETIEDVPALLRRTASVEDVRANA